MLESGQRRVLQLAFDRFIATREWPTVDQLQHALDASADDLDVVQVGEGLDAGLARVDRGYQGRVTLTLRGIHGCVGGSTELQAATEVMQLAYRRWIRDGPGAQVSSADVEAELGMAPELQFQLLERIPQGNFGSGVPLQ